MMYCKRKISLLLFIIVGFSFSYSQNLVVNPGMDAKGLCKGYGEINKSATWSNANGGSVDLFDKSKAIPENYMGYQPGVSSDQNYAGIIAFYDDGSNNREDSINNAALKIQDGYKRYSEYIQGLLTETLIAGKAYQVSFKVNLANESGRAVSCLGALLTSSKVEQKSNTFINENPQFISYRIISDSLNWVMLSGTYIAVGDEKYITIGCFKNEFFQVKKTVNAMQNDSRKAYYYISSIAVIPYVSKPEMDAIISGVDYVELMDLRFATGSSDISSQYFAELNVVSGWMINHPEMSFFIAGYTDKTGDDVINDPLSVNRANEVKKYFVSKGVNGFNLITDGFGSNKPIEDKIKSRKNRRVEIYLNSTSKVSKL